MKPTHPAGQNKCFKRARARASALEAFGRGTKKKKLFRERRLGLKGKEERNQKKKIKKLEQKTNEKKRKEVARDAQTDPVWNEKFAGSGVCGRRKGKVIFAHDLAGVGHPTNPLSNRALAIDTSLPGRTTETKKKKKRKKKRKR